MKIMEFLEIGNILRIEEIRYDKNIKSEVYETKVSDIDIEKNEVSIWMPVKKGNLVPLRSGQEIRIIRTHEDGLYYFKSRILSRYLRPYPHFKVRIPEKLGRIQRRNYVRISCHLPLEFSKVGDEEIFGGVILNISGGGIYFTSKEKLFLQDELYADYEVDKNLIFSNMRIIINRIDKYETDNGIRYGYAADYIEINEKLREKLISFIFLEQRERVQKGIEV